MTEVIALMREAGFTTNEARAYLALLGQSPATGYELASRSGVPRSAVYGVLKRLDDTGWVTAVDAEPVRYVPMPPDELIGRLRRHFDRLLAALEEGLDGLSRHSDAGALWRVRGYDDIMERAVSLVGDASESLYISAWSREVELLEAELRAACARGVRTILFSFCPLPDGIGEIHSYGLPPEKLEEFWSHRLILVADRSRVLMGGADATNDQTSAVLSDDPDTVDTAIHNIAMDITLYAQRQGLDVTGAMAEMLRDSIGRLDELLEG